MADLNAAKKDAAARSLESKKTFFIDMAEGGVCTVVDKQTAASLHAFEGGNEVPLPTLSLPKEEKPAKVKVTKATSKSKVKTKNKKKMATETKAPAKKAAKKAAPAKGDKLIGKATTISLSKGDWAKVDKAIEAGKGSIRDLASRGILKAL